MRRTLGAVIVVALVNCTGCFLTAPPASVVAQSKELDVAKARPPVTPNTVTEQNYRSIPQALWDEMDREEQQNLLGRSGRD